MGEFYISNNKPFNKIKIGQNQHNGGGVSYEPIELEDGTWAVPEECLEELDKKFINPPSNKKPIIIGDIIKAKQIIESVSKLKKVKKISLKKRDEDR